MSELGIAPNRPIVYAALTNATRSVVGSPFAALVPAFDQAECLRVLEIVGALMDMGCSEFCCVGNLAEILHDDLDLVVETRGAFDVVTTWHLVQDEACEYFLFAAGGGQLNLFALVLDHPELHAALESGARAKCEIAGRSTEPGGP